jgi:DNA polymerase elongation subunit (family B)
MYSSDNYTYKQNNFNIGISGLGLIDLLTASKKFHFGKECGYSLKEMSNAYLEGVSKIDIGDIDLAYKNNFNELVFYNIIDVYLTVELNRELGIINKLMDFHNIVNMNLDKTVIQGNVIDSYIMQHSDIILYDGNEKEGGRGEKAEGGKVLKTIPGIYTNSHKFDFASMYPSIIISYNISPDTLLKEKEKDCINMDNRFYYSNKKEGCIANITKDLYENRFKYVRSNKGLSVAFKENANSVYGQMLATFSRISNFTCGQSITYQGRRLLGMVYEKIELKFKGQVILGDTDSIIFNSENPKFNPDDLIKEVNKIFESVYKSDNIKRNKYLKIKYEGKIDRLLIFGKATGEGIKKKYIEYTKGKKPEYTGMDLIKSDTQRIAKELQKEIGDYFIYNTDANKEGLEEIVASYKIKFNKALKEKNYDYVAIPTKLNKSIKKYKGEPMLLKAINNSGLKVYTGEIFYILITDLGPLAYKTKTDLDNMTEIFEIDDNYLWERILKKVEMFYYLLGERLKYKGKAGRHWLFSKKKLKEIMIPLFDDASVYEQ